MKKVTITSAIVLGATLIAGTASSADRKNYSGSTCTPEFPNGASYRRDSGRTTNTGSGWMGLTCPVVQDDTALCPSDLDMHGFDGDSFFGSDVVCNFQSYSVLTGSLITTSTKTSTSPATGNINWDWPAMGSCYTGQESSLHLFCGIPGPEPVSGTLSYVSGYSVSEG